MDIESGPSIRKRFSRRRFFASLKLVANLTLGLAGLVISSIFKIQVAHRLRRIPLAVATRGVEP
ncbi:MAG: hypothetical protein ACKO8U_05850, partial [Pirellula sp.]